MTPKTCKTANADLPESPVAAELADQAQAGKAKAGRSSESQNSTDDDQNQEKVWISIQLNDEEGNAVPNAAYEIRVPNEKGPRTGKLNGQGKATIEGIDSGDCQVCFPEIHADEWKKIAENSKKGG